MSVTYIIVILFIIVMIGSLLYLVSLELLMRQVQDSQCFTDIGVNVCNEHQSTFSHSFYFFGDISFFCESNDRKRITEEFYFTDNEVEECLGK